MHVMKFNTDFFDRLLSVATTAILGISLIIVSIAASVMQTRLNSKIDRLEAYVKYLEHKHECGCDELYIETLKK